ncbi:lytic transglycosylase domain-containing protein [Enterobacteriaceae bacterium H20N1]|uniref:Lytic transglycosylase domain-containing protein n=1 Tax=Dryocola boscaweniae TaxID=2925397 RepID=A0A9X2W5G1_9ENTR|nr:lytic transglycosylase domain-containing protein [Dryocola boscaweniae]MCT4700542.1 lytic transglycosylase domain-containing protein [Dryocola boscaweniae]MCT4717698.1 lytic transglycosylase domain-containing protein [Dryocola boscaweniae]
MLPNWRWLLLLIFLCCHTATAWCFNLAAEEFHLEPQIIYAIAKAESNLNTNAIHTNHNGSFDIGLMQINSIHEPELGRLGISMDELMEPCKNIIVGTWLLRKSIDRAGELWKGIALYHSATPAYGIKYVLRIRSIYSRLSNQELRNFDKDAG